MVALVIHGEIDRAGDCAEEAGAEDEERQIGRQRRQEQRQGGRRGQHLDHHQPGADVCDQTAAERHRQQRAAGTCEQSKRKSACRQVEALLDEGNVGSPRAPQDADQQKRESRAASSALECVGGACRCHACGRAGCLSRPARDNAGRCHPR